jgi:membrane associated rhomboid family serine protease
VQAWRRPSTGAFGFPGQQTSSVKALLIANITVFILMWLSPQVSNIFVRLFGLVPELAIPRLEVWQFFTYMFLHGGFWHLALNMFALWMFGPEIEAYWGRRIFLVYYFFCGLGGGLTYVATSWGSPIPLVGASGAIFGILLAYGMMFPDRRILLYFLFPIKAKYFVMIIGAFELLASQQSRQDGIGHFAHLGGMLFGYLFLLYARRGGRRLSWAGLTSWWRRPRRSGFRVVGRDAGGDRGTGAGGDGGDVPDRERVDRILEKISREGLNSLTPEEQDILRRASRKH